MNIPVDRPRAPGWAATDVSIAPRTHETVSTPALAANVRRYLRLRAAIEWLLALGLLAAATPLLVVLGLIVKLTSEGPVIYSQWRVGRLGKPFRIYKIRTMTHRCETRTGPVWAVADDPRTTRPGRWLRDSHLDELPQLWNVLCGHMSLIGPRPERPEIAARIEQTLPEFRHRLLVRPGIIGLAQMRLPADSDLGTVRRKLAHDLYYIQHVSPLMDARLVLSTPLRFFGDVALSISRRIARPITLPVPLATEDHSTQRSELPTAGTRELMTVASLGVAA